jgi:hypothetical protein
MLGLDIPVLASSDSPFKGLPSRLRPFGLQVDIIFGTLLFILVSCRSQLVLSLLIYITFIIFNIILPLRLCLHSSLLSSSFIPDTSYGSLLSHGLYFPLPSHPLDVIVLIIFCEKYRFFKLPMMRFFPRLPPFYIFCYACYCTNIF